MQGAKSYCGENSEADRNMTESLTSNPEVENSLGQQQTFSAMKSAWRQSGVAGDCLDSASGRPYVADPRHALTRAFGRTGGGADLVLSADDLKAIDEVLPIVWAHGDRYAAGQ
jgi:hypothetical protein